MLSLCLRNHTLCHEDVWEIGDIIQPFSTSELQDELSYTRDVLHPEKEFPVPIR
jgi:hypothetical protein